MPTVTPMPETPPESAETAEQKYSISDDQNSSVSNITKAIPHNREAEEAVIGAVLIDPEVFDDLACLLKSDDFYVHRHRWIWNAFISIKEKGNPIDFLTVTETLEANGTLGEIGGPAYLTTLLNATPTSLHALTYAEMILDASVRRKALTVANNIANLAYNYQQPFSQQFGLLANQVADLTAVQIGKSIPGLYASISEEYDKIIKRTENPCDVWGIATHFPGFDHETGGFQLGELAILAGEPGIGKTWLALTFAVKMALYSPGVFFSFEMSKQQLIQRLLAGIGNLSARSLRSGKLDDNGLVRLSKTVAALENLPLYICDENMDTWRLRSTLINLKKKGITWFWLDYLSLLLDEGKDSTERTAMIGRRLKNICKELNLSGNVINSVVKSGMDREGSEAQNKSNMSGSGQVIHDADTIFFLTEYCPESGLKLSDQAKKRLATLWCVKGREMEDSKWRLGLTRLPNSPFWGEIQRT